MTVSDNRMLNGVEASAGPLCILIAGSGIGGLATAIALRQQGHYVDIFEQSKLSQETGAAMNLTPNCTGLLARLGVDLERIGAVECLGTICHLVNKTSLTDPSQDSTHLRPTAS